MMRFTVAVFAAILPACSLIIDTKLDSDDLDCGATSDCPDGSSCLVGYCVKDGALTEGETCSEERQCESGLVCPSGGPFICAKPCSGFFESGEDCSDDQVCEPYRTDSGWTGACRGGYCDDDPGCGPGFVCALSLCQPGCEIAWSEGRYQDDCESAEGNPVSCQPLDRMVCLPASLSGGTKGDTCSLVVQPCQPGLACIDGECRAYCDTEAECDAGEACNLHGDANASYEICEAGG